MRTPRPYQVTAIRSVHEAWTIYRSALLVLATGLGKTAVASWILEERAKTGRILWIAHRRELIAQAKAALESVGLKCEIEMGQEWAKLSAVDMFGVHTHCVIATVQTLQRARLKRFRPDSFDTIVIDETHHATAQTYRDIIAHFPEAKVLGMTHGGWTALGVEQPPPLEKGEVGIDVGANFDSVPVRLYAWGQKDTDWARTGRMQLRFGDRFSQVEVRSSSITASPWSSEGDALSALGQVGGGMNWQAALDGDAALASGCRGDRQCLLFATEAGQPVVGLRMADDTPLSRPQGGAVRVGATWFFLGDSRGDEFSLFRADLGTVRLVSSFKRALLSRTASPPRLVRKARGTGLGFLFVQKQGPNDRRGTRYVLPIDPESGELGEVEPLGRADFGGMEFEPCGDREGWLVESQVDSQSVTVDGVLSDSRSVELRMRLRHGKACVEGGVVRSLGDEGPPKPRGKNEALVKAGFSLVLNGPYGVKSMVCRSVSSSRLRAF